MQTAENSLIDEIFVSSSLQVKTIPEWMVSNTESLFIGENLFWKLTPPVYARLRFAVMTRLDSKDPTKRIAKPDAERMLDGLAKIEEVLFASNPNARDEVKRLMPVAHTIKLPPAPEIPF